MCTPLPFNYITSIFIPDAANYNITVTVFIDITQFYTFSMRTINNPFRPRVVFILSPYINFITCFMAELGLVSRNNIQIAVVVQITEFYIVGGMISNFVGLPNVLCRIIMRPWIFIPYQTAHNDIQITIAVNIACFTIYGLISTFRYDCLCPTRVRIPYKRTVSASNNDI